MPRQTKIPIERFFSLKEDYRVTFRDLDIVVFGLDYIKNHPMLKCPAFIALIYDSEQIHTILPLEIKIKQGIKFKNSKGFKILSFNHTSKTKQLWRKRIMNIKRGIPGSTAWDETTMENNIVWKTLQKPESFAILDPNKSKNDKTKKLFIPSIALPPALVIEKTPNCPKIEEYLTCILTHEGEVHLTDMWDLPWLPSEKSKEQKPEANSQSFYNLMEKITNHPKKLPKIQTNRRYLGELLAYMVEILRAKTLSKEQFGFNFQDYLKLTKNGADSLNKIRDQKIYPKIHKNKWGFEIAKFLVEKVNFDRKKVLKIMFEIRKLMVSEEKARKMFLEKDIHCEKKLC